MTMFIIIPFVYICERNIYTNVYSYIPLEYIFYDQYHKFNVSLVLSFVVIRTRSTRLEIVRLPLQSVSLKPCGADIIFSCHCLSVKK